MGFQAKRELLLQTGLRYSEASGHLKTNILDEFVMATGYNRKYAIRLLNRPAIPSALGIVRPRERKYGPTIQEALGIAWRAANCICAKRLVPFLPELIPLLEHHGYLVISPETRCCLLSVSAATADRLLRTSRKSSQGRGISMTKPGTLLKRQIPLRTFTDWEDTQVGFFEVDLVAHCGTSVAGTFLWSLVMTDVASGWTECFALLQRSAKGVVVAIQHIQKILPFPILGIDTDNGTEFINADLVEFCKLEQITFTRGRVHRKNDQCFVEQKNGSIVRQVVGYDRYDGLTALRQLSELYRALRLYVNFYQPSMKLKAKSRDGAKVSRTYFPAQTPLQRVFASCTLAEPTQQKLDQLRKSLDPVMLLRLLRTLQDALWRYANLAAVAEVALATEASPVFFTLGACIPTNESQSAASKSLELARKGYRRSRKPRKPRTYRTRKDPFEAVNATLLEWFLESPETTAKSLLGKLQSEQPGAFHDHLLRTLQRKVSQWRATTLLEFLSPWNEESPDEPALRGATIL